jgi:hypothetical protein
MCWSYEIFAAEVRRALSQTIPPESLDPSRVSNVEIQNKLLELSRIAKELDSEISNLDPHSDTRLKNAAFRNSGLNNFIGFIFSRNNEYYKFHKAAFQLSFLASFLRSASENVEPQAHKWQQSEIRRLRIWRGTALIPIFEGAFCQKITLNGWPSDSRARAPTPFMDFYQRMVKLAFGEATTADLSSVLKEAKRSVK